MAIYHASLTELPVITPESHTITLSIYRPDPEHPHHTPYSIGTLAFSKNPSETWPEAAARLRSTISDFIATYEHQLRLNSLISAWLFDQEWET